MIGLLSQYKVGHYYKRRLYRRSWIYGYKKYILIFKVEAVVRNGIHAKIIYSNSAYYTNKQHIFLYTIGWNDEEIEESEAIFELI